MLCRVVSCLIPVSSLRIQSHVCMHVCMLQLILKSSNMRGSNCLHIACQKGHYKLAKYLVVHKVPINGQNNTGNTPFHFACENGHIKLAKWLSENGANLWM